VENEKVAHEKPSRLMWFPRLRLRAGKGCGFVRPHPDVFAKIVFAIDISEPIENIYLYRHR
jgi:hypothetical protein